MNEDLVLTDCEGDILRIGPVAEADPAGGAAFVATPAAGVYLTPSQAREAAAHLVKLADEIEGATS